MSLDPANAIAIAQSEDYALLINPASHSWLVEAIQVQQEFDRYLWSAEPGGYYNTDA